MSTSSASLCPWAVSKCKGTLHPVVFSTPLPCSPPLHHLQFLVAFSTPSPSSTSTSSSPPPPHLLHLLIVFSTPVSYFPCHCGATFAGVLRIVVVSHRWLLPSTPSSFCSVCHYAGVAFPSSLFASWDTMPASYFLIVHCHVALLIVPYAWIVLLSMLRTSSGKPFRWSLCMRWALGDARGR